MDRKSFYSRRVIEKRKRRLRRVGQRSNYLGISSDSEEENQHTQETQSSACQL
jgi:hypothetical protein